MAESNRIIVDAIRAAWKPERGAPLDYVVRASYHEERHALDERAIYLLSTFGHMDGNELSEFVEALLQHGDATSDSDSLQRLQQLALDAKDAALLLSAAMQDENRRNMYIIVADEYARVGEHFTQRLEARQLSTGSTAIQTIPEQPNAIEVNVSPYR